MARGAITVKIDGQYDDKDINRAIKDLNALKSQAAPTGSAFGGLTDSLKAVGIAAAAFGGFKVVTDFMGDAITKGSALAESQSKIGVVFGETANDVREWSETSATAMGISQQAALEAAGTYGNLFQAFGLGRDESKKMSTSLVQLASDLASFNNTSVDDALIALRSGLSGETEPLKRYGIALTDARLKAEAFAQGIYDGKGPLDAGQKSQAAYAIAMKDSSLAQGDFVRTGDGFANTMRTVSAEADDAKAAIGGALLGAIERVTSAFGGAASVGGAIDSFGSGIADLITGMGETAGQIATIVAALANWVGANNAATESSDETQSSIAGWVQVIPIVGSYLATWANNGAETTAQTEKLTQVVDAQSARLTGLAASLSPTAVKTKELADAEADAKAAADDLTASIKRFESVISASQARDDFKKSLADLDVTLKGNARSFKGMGDASKENRDTLREALSDAARIAKQWGTDTGASADEIDAKYKTMRKNIIQGFKDAGFKSEDIKAFMGKEGLWRTPAKDAVQAAADAASANAKPSFALVGKDIALGAAAGVRANARQVANEAIRMVQLAEIAARAESETHSPSKVWARVGSDIVDGLVVGLRSKDDKVKQAATDMMQALSDKAAEMVGKWDDRLSTLSERLTKAKDEMAQFATSVSSSIMSAINFGSANDLTSVGEDGKAVGMSFLDGLKAQAAQAIEFAKQVTQLIQMGLSRESLQQVLAAGVTAGSAIATELIDGGATAITETNDLVSSTQDAATKVGELAGTTFFGTGVGLAQSAYDGFAANFGKGGPARVAMENLMDRLADSLHREVTVTVRTVYEAAGNPPGRAVGGPVASGMPYVVGERGPELFVPSVSGTIIPNNASLSGGSPATVGGSAGGNSYAITVQAGVGDPRQIGQQIVEYIKRYEAANGPVYAAA